MTISTGQRKSNVLVPSSLRCLSGMPTINITSGCAHGCLYCYGSGYPTYPGEGKILLYANIAEKVSDELKRKRKKPRAAYFCPSCDPFQNLPEVLKLTYQTMEILLKNNIGVQFVTKARVPDRFVSLFEKYPSLVCGQVGLITADDSLRRIFEPNASPVSERVSCLKKLAEAGIEISLRADPLIHGVTDSDKQIRALCEIASQNGLAEIAVGYMFLRPPIRRSLARSIGERDLLQKVLEPYSNGKWLEMVSSNSKVLVLPREMRAKSFERIKRIAGKYGVTIRLCGCKNPDITTESCNITRPVDNRESSLFD